MEDQQKIGLRSAGSTFNFNFRWGADMGTDMAKKTILLVEDNILNAKLFRDLLEVKGYIVIHVDDGEKAVEAAQANPDLILMDINLPLKSGTEAAKEIRKNPWLIHVPIIAVTAFAMNGDKEKFLDAGCTDYISKPVSINNFYQMVEKHMK